MVEVTPGGTAPTARYGQRAEWDDAGGRLWIFAGNDDTGPLLSVVQHAYSTYWKSVREIRFGKASFKKRGAVNDLFYYDLQARLSVAILWSAGTPEGFPAVKGSFEFQLRHVWKGARKAECYLCPCKLRHIFRGNLVGSLAHGSRSLGLKTSCLARRINQIASDFPRTSESQICHSRRRMPGWRWLQEALLQVCGIITIRQSMPVRVASTSTMELTASGAGAFAWLHKLSVCTEHPKLSYDKASAQWTQWTQHQFIFQPIHDDHGWILVVSSCSSLCRRRRDAFVRRDWGTDCRVARHQAIPSLHTWHKNHGWDKPVCQDQTTTTTVSSGSDWSNYQKSGVHPCFCVMSPIHQPKRAAALWWRWTSQFSWRHQFHVESPTLTAKASRHRAGARKAAISLKQLGILISGRVVLGIWLVCYPRRSGVRCDGVALFQTQSHRTRQLPRFKIVASKR